MSKILSWPYDEGVGASDYEDWQDEARRREARWRRGRDYACERYAIESAEGRPLPIELTEREQRIFELRREGLTYKAIGEEVGLVGSRVSQIQRRTVLRIKYGYRISDTERRHYALKSYPNTLALNFGCLLGEDDIRAATEAFYLGQLDWEWVEPAKDD